MASGEWDSAANFFDYGWLGQHRRGLEHSAGITTVEMDARQYVPGLGRFLEVDPVEGGSADDYDYMSGDPRHITVPHVHVPRISWFSREEPAPVNEEQPRARGDSAQDGSW